MLQGLAGGAGGLFVLAGIGTGNAKFVAGHDDDDDEDHSGHGGGGNSGPGGGDDRDGDAAGEVEVAAGVVQAEAGSAVVQIFDDDGFTPATLTVNPGQTITFVNLDNDDHTATGSGFDTGIIVEEVGTATIVLDEPGTYAYSCLIHPEMAGTIGVVGPDGTVPPPVAAAPLPADATPVQIANFAFSPVSVSVPVGATVAWTNVDSAPHTVTARDGAFDSGILDPNGGFSQTFDAPGTFAYQCALHPVMQGEVVVSGDAAAAASAEQPASQEPAAAATNTVAASAVDAAGTWLIEVIPEGTTGETRHALVTVNADGSAIAELSAASDATDSIAGLAGRGHGTWEQDDSNGYSATIVALLLDDQDQFAGTLILRDAGQLDEAGETLTGTFTIEIRAANGDAAEVQEGESRGTRIDIASEPDAPPATPVEDEADAPLVTSGETAAAAAERIVIEDFAFNPPTIEIPVGTTITWVNQGQAPHTATADDGAFDTDRLVPGQEASETFAEAGSFPYTCLFHPDMHGTVTVV